MTHAHAPGRVRLLVLMALLVSMIGLMTLTLATPPANAAVTPAATSCSSYPTWVAGQSYAVGAIVEYPANGQYYIATNANPGYDPTISTWYWSPYTCTGSGGGSTSCSGYPTWVAGQSYAVGAIVEYPANGQYYIATNANPGYDPTISTWYWSPYSCTGSGGGTGGGGSSGFVVSEAQFDQMFPNRNSFYTYSGLVAALSSYPGFATTGSATVQKQEAAAFLANVDHETGGLVYVTEIDQSGDYCASESYGCPAGTYAYYGRGPLQISWNFNYEAAGNALGVDLLDNPGLVATNASVSWETALWYWDTQTGPGSMTAHNAIVNGAGFGQTIEAINGSVECNGGNTAEMQDRVNDYESFTSILGVSPGSNLTC
ncbi:glycoside hydrolase family 19 protein [Streptacidiphilus sp. P02-A3a]|uniref:glycoside hydrolase family 19 protein n=1 Tax=Streptacidiphilus sp. P02-A3a TaxID=2704468 RepID=UPI0015F8F7D3|nr:glycoside hydrolase family 19 protein [Streptacidiphilus sp. P02-A3a]QMU69952.1 chitinase [Streptacidiphilus sp. P02-A3a]